MTPPIPASPLLTAALGARERRSRPPPPRDAGCHPACCAIAGGGDCGGDRPLPVHMLTSLLARPSAATTWRTGESVWLRLHHRGSGMMGYKAYRPAAVHG